MSDEAATTIPEPTLVHDGEYHIEIRQDGRWPNSTEPAYSFRVLHDQYGIVFEQPLAASNVGFCVAKGTQVIVQKRAEEAARQAEGNAQPS